MKEKVEKIIRKFLGPLVVGILLLIVNAMIGGITFKMVYETLINLDILVVFVVICIIIAAIFGSIYIKQRWKDSLSYLKSELKEKTKQHNDLVGLTKLPKTVDRAITVEESPDWGSDPIIITNRYGKFPHLRFDMRVINRTYYSYEAEEATAKCSCGSEEVLDKEGTWDNNTKKSETFEWVSNLPVWGGQGDGKIMFHVPIKELYDDMTTWRLGGKVKYKSKEPLVEGDTQYANPEIDIDVEYVLSEKQITELKKEVEKALGDDI